MWGLRALFVAISALVIGFGGANVVNAKGGANKTSKNVTTQTKGIQLQSQQQGSFSTESGKEKKSKRPKAEKNKGAAPAAEDMR
jgi:hypothetical protein